MTLLGYLVSLTYIFFLIFAVGPLVQRFSNTETSRKTIHILLFAVWSLIDVFFRGTIHQILIPVFFIVMNLLSYRFGIYKSVERESGNHLGTVYFAIAVTVVMSISYFLPEFYYPGGISIFCLTFGDGFAALLGYNLKSRTIYRGKSAIGFAACFAASALSVLVFSLVYPATLELSMILLIGIFAAVLELMDHGLDNFTIVLGTFFLSYGFLNGNPEGLAGSIAAGIAVFAIVFFTGAIDYYGSLLALGMLFVFSFWGGAFGLWYLLATYFTVFFVSVYKHKILRRPKKSSGRTFRQILINGGLGTVFMILYGITGHPGPQIVSIVAIGGCFVDSLSSDVGILSKAEPYDPIRRKHVPAGISGGMTALGTGAALMGSAAIAVASAAFLNVTLPTALGMGMLLFAQSLADTLLGSLWQVKYECPVCNAVTEQKTHCDQPTRYLRGAVWMDNNMVNLLTSILTTGIAALVFWR